MITALSQIIKINPQEKEFFSVHFAANSLSAALQSYFQIQQQDTNKFQANIEIIGLYLWGGMNGI